MPEPRHTIDAEREPCPRCKTGRFEITKLPGQSWEASCIQCGFAVYESPPLPFHRERADHPRRRDAKL